jgi:4'-phosphopantetheinyl transferase
MGQRGQITAVPAPPLESVHLWITDVGRRGLCREFAAELSRDECGRIERVRDPVHRYRKGASRAFLRRTLSLYLETPPQRIDLVVGPHGKPRLAAGQESDPTLHFNLAHSDELVLLAVSGASRLGVDVERVREMDDLEDLVRRCLTPAEVDLLSSGGIARTEGFLRLWTRKEALLKGLGLGLTLDPGTISVLDPENPTLTENRPALPPHQVHGWTLLDLAPADGFVGALAIEVPGLGVQRFVDDSFV